MRKKILIVEDDVLLVKAISYEFEQENFEVFTAGNGEDGLAMAEEHLPDLILADINMPKMDGLTMLKELRATEWGKNILVIMLTNYSDEQRVLEALSQKAFYYLVKSDWDLSQIVAKVREKLGS
ncbi:response regulator [Candidatus Falkowbacteria bacterium CG10_big_fil_rev_8_21_14_0_10_39_9]|uniref:Response regulator n=1 Tax=Candidatus Falkowbacteria bacterium CG10_big_fil_rev_8_21_14_0_10_39_9 TaxID=1974566 RepID=A0A2M6WRA5_9BACT|nr:MAG: response regulator [Candidatus Falkowbacteria bacterium CG10_big_fil_rev_8_21_14_0_10_39_9]